MNELFISELIINKTDDGDIFNNYPFTLPVLKNMDSLSFDSKVTFLVGENGTGKSTLLEAIAVSYGFNPEGGSRNFNFSTRKTHSALHKYITLKKGIKRPSDGYFLRAESFYNVATEIELLDEIPAAAPDISASYGGVSLHAQSHGESFLSLILNRFGCNGLYLLDEPEAALSPTKQLTLLTRINDLLKQDSQFIMATHSPILMSFPGARIYLIDSDGINPCDYKETEHYKITKQFLNNPERMLSYLL